MENRERLVIVLKHLIEHNEGHKEDYTRWVELATEAGMEKVAFLIGEARTHVENAGKALKEALDLVVG
jgi:hypothetical protein